MAVKQFECMSCEAQGKISFKEDELIRTIDIAYCPFCGGDISDNEEEVDDEEI